MRKLTKYAHLICFIFLLFVSCKTKNKNLPSEEIKAINLKRGELILCGPGDGQYGTVAFDVSCSGKVKKDFNLAVALLHSFEYEQAEKVFAKVVDEEPGCAMAYWGVAMCNNHPLWAPATQSEFDKGAKAIEIAKSFGEKAQHMPSHIFHPC